MATASPPEIEPHCLAGFDDFVHASLAQWGAPGVAVAVIIDGKVAHAQGYGLRDVANRLPVTADTLFAIGSCTKAFTTMVMGTLVDEGKLDWDAPVRTYLPTFALHDPVATDLMTPRDLVTHRSGLPRHDLSWFQSPCSRIELYDRLKYLPPNKTFRQAAQYQNLMYMTAGHLSGVVTGVEWEDLVRWRILMPLGMSRTALSAPEAEKDADCSRPYEDILGELTAVPHYNLAALGPAGSLYSSVNEMSRWLLLHLNKGMHEGTRVISEAQLAEMHAPQVVMPERGTRAEMPYACYGLGWAIQPYRNQTTVWHTGGIDGFLSRVTLLPDRNAACVVLSNKGEGALVSVLSFHLLDRLLGLDHLPWNERLWQEQVEAKATLEAANQAVTAGQVPGTSPSHPLEAFTGEFAHSGYGRLTVSEQDGQLAALYNQQTYRLAHYHYDTFLAVDPSHPEVRYLAAFAVNPRGEIESVALPFEPAAAAIVFQREPVKRL
ncbi:MAG TPA: serine hydrolase [Chloroflexota bacterium]|nr:serine hydrolase [Chloroflexota bacterium]